MEHRTWKINIPVRPKAVQSARGDRGHFHVDPKVRKWKDEIRPYIRADSPGRPSKMPIRAVALRYYYRLPKTASKKIQRYVESGGLVPYLAPVDITDNLSKGVIDVCKGIVFEDDSQIWHIAEVQKLYGLTDHIELEFEETPDVVLINGKTGNSLELENKVQGNGESVAGETATS